LFLSQLDPGSIGGIDGQLTQMASHEGIAGALVTIQGPLNRFTTSSLSPLYSPNPALTPSMRAQIDNLIATAPQTISPESLAAAAVRMEAQFLGLPVPPAPPTVSEAPQQNGITDGGGHFSFIALKPGRYDLRIQREGFFG